MADILVNIIVDAILLLDVPRKMVSKIESI